MKRVAFIALMLATLAPLAPAVRGEGVDTKQLAPFLDGRTVAVLHLNIKALDVAAVTKKLDALAGRPLLEGDLPAGWVKAVRDLARAGVQDLFVVGSLADAPEAGPFVVVPRLAGEEGARLILDALRAVPELGGAEVMGKAVVAADPGTRKRLRALKPVARPEISAALEGVKGPTLARLALVPTTDTPRILEEVMPELPAELGGGPIKPLSRGLRWVGVGLEMTPKARLELVVQARDAESARALEAVWKKLVEAAPESKVVKQLAPWLGPLLRGLVPKLAGDRLVLTLDEKELSHLLGPLAGRAAQARAEGKMHRVLAGLLAYEAKHGHFPAHASFDRDGKPLLSWRVHLLPFLGEETLYKEFKLNEPWDGPHNRKLLEKMPAAFRPASPKLAAAFKTTFLVPVGEGTLFPPKRGVPVREVKGGLSNTVALVDVADGQAVEWTRPSDLPFDPDRPLRGLAARYPGGLMLGKADGEVAFFPADTRPESLRERFLRAGR